MSRSSRKQRSRRKKRTVKQTIPVQTIRDRTIYIGLLAIGGFIILLAGLLTEGRYWKEFALAYALVMVWLINYYTLRVYFGKHMANWKLALARIPLHFVGYGTKEGKPVDAAHGRPDARRMVIISIVVSLVIVAGLWWWVRPEQHLFG